MSDIINNGAAGLIRIDNEIVYHSSTQRAEEFLNARLSAAVSGWNNQHPQNMISDEGIGLVSRVYSCIKKDSKPVFVPFWLNMPLSALEDGQYGNKNKNSGAKVDLMYLAGRHLGDTDGDTGTASVLLKVPYAGIVRQYGYKDGDLKSLLCDHETLRAYHLNPEMIHKIRKQAKPRIHRFRKGNTRVIVLIDPRKVFNDMVVAGNKVTTDLNNRPFDIKLHAERSTSTGKWDYRIHCVIVNSKKNKKKNRGDMTANEIVTNDLANGNI